MSLLSEGERRQLLMEGKGAAERYPEATVIELIEHQAANRPGAIAVVYDKQSLSYRELNRRANQLAHYLRGLGVGAEIRVALCLERRIEMIIGMLGILKAGGAYVPLEAGYPPERLAYMLKEAQAPVLLTQAHLRDRLSISRAQLVLLDRDWIEIGREPEHAPERKLHSGNLAYVLFTSGSTGLPKGVAIQHGSLKNYVRAIEPALKLPGEANYALVSTLAADLGYTGLYGSLCSGGTLHVMSEDRVLDAEAMSRYFEQRGIECCKAVPSLWQALMGGEQSEGVVPLKRLVLGGEATSWQLIEEIERRGNGCRIYNHYGPSETTIGVLTSSINGKPGRSIGIPPVGRPIANTSVYVMDEEQEPVPVGVSGELYIGGGGGGGGGGERGRRAGGGGGVGPAPPAGGGRGRPHRRLGEGTSGGCC